MKKLLKAILYIAGAATITFIVLVAGSLLCEKCRKKREQTSC
jgi:hypothetical protein